MTDAGISTCPLCGTRWVVTALRDCLVPACGCHGRDTSHRNPARPCEPCGLAHATSCPKLGAGIDPPGSRADGRRREPGAPDGRDAWRKAIADHNKRKRNQRVYRPYQRDPYARPYAGIRKPPEGDR